jgi:predicted RNA-binding Zn ribbon-like protein
VSPRASFPQRVGGRLCLDFVNTVDPRRPGEARDYLGDYDEVLDWFVSVDVALPRSVSWLRRRARQRPQEARDAFLRTTAMREALFATIDASRQGGLVHRKDLVELNRALSDSAGHRFLAAAERGGVEEAWRTADSLAQVLWPVAIDAWDLLTEPELGQVRQCPMDAGGCGWLFLDASRARNRRWCDMRTCGNRAKVRAHYSRSVGA